VVTSEVQATADIPIRSCNHSPPIVVTSTIDFITRVDLLLIINISVASSKTRAGSRRTSTVQARVDIIGIIIIICLEDLECEVGVGKHRDIPGKIGQALIVWIRISGAVGSIFVIFRCIPGGIWNKGFAGGRSDEEVEGASVGRTIIIR